MLKRICKNFKIALAFILVINYENYAQNCNNPIVITSTATYNYTNYVLDSLTTYFKFTADTSSLLISVINQNYSANSQCFKLEVLSGSCSNFQLFKNDSLNSGSDSLLFIQVKQLSIGVDYYIKLIRNSNSQNCTIGLSLNKYNTCPFAQDPCDLVVNGGFEDGSIPSGAGQLPLATGRDFLNPGCSNTQNNTPDVFDINAPAGYNANNIYGNESPHLGSCRMGNYGGYESFFGSLSTFLIPNFIYQFSFWYSVQDQFCNGNIPNNVVIVALKNGMNCLPSQTIFTSGSLTTPCTDWAPALQIFSTTSSNFDHIEFSLAPANYNGLYIDDVSIVALTGYAGPPATICQGQSTQLNATGGTSYSWNPNATLSNSNIANPIATPSVTTIYTVTTTLTSGCTVTATVQVNVNSSFTLNVTSTQTCTNTGTAYASITGGTPPYNFQWSNGQATNPAIGLSPGTYTVTVTDAGGCSKTATTIVSTTSLSVTIQGLPDLCSGNIQSCTALPNPPGTAGTYTYNWTVTGGIISSGGGSANITIDWANGGIQIGGTVTVLITSTNGCTATYTYNVAACCFDSSYPNFVNHTFTANITQQTYNLNGVTTFDGNITVNSSTFLMGPKATIVLTPGSTLTITDNSHLKAGCNYMWDGIIADNSNEHIIIKKFSSVEDATTGLSATNGARFTIDQANFNKNYVHVNSNNCNSTSIILNSTFDCTNNGVIFCLLPPYSGQHTLRAVNSITSLLNIGDLNSVNYISNCDVGIVGAGSVITSINNTFTNCMDKGIWTFHGAAVTANNCTFNNSGYAVEASYTTLNVELNNNTFNYNLGSLYVHNCPKLNLHVNNNIFIADKYFAVNSQFNLQSVQVIEGNNIQGGGYAKAIGIYVGESSPDPLSTYDIQFNQIIQMPHGIVCVLLERPNVFANNPISVLPNNDPNLLTYGIALFKCTGGNVKYNTIDGDIANIPYWWSNGIFIDNSPEVNVICNTVGNIGNGLWFAGITNGTVAGNVMGDCWSQFFLNWCALGLGDQGFDINGSPPDGFPFDNQWAGVPLTVQGGHQTYSYYSNISFNGGYTTFHARPNNPFGPTDNFVFGGAPCGVNILSTYANPLTYCELLHRPVNDNEVQDRRIAGDSINFTGLAAFKWLAKFYLYQKLDANDSLRNSYLRYVQQHDSLAQTNIGELTTLGDSISHLADDSIDVAELNQLLALNNNINPQLAIEAYLKATNKILLKNLNKISPSYTPTQINTLRLIGSKCPYEYGPAVYAAWNLLMAIDTVINFENNCIGFNPLAPRYANSNEGNMRYQFIVTPNPSEGETEIISNRKIEGNVSLHLYDAIGRLVNVSFTNTQNTVFKIISGIENKGIYNCIIYSNNDVIGTIKLAVK